MNRLEAELKRACGVIAAAGLTGLLAFAVLSVADGLSRSLLGVPIDVVRDLGGVWLAASIVCCMPMAAATRAHVDVWFMGEMLGSKAAAMLDTMVALVVAGVMSAMTYQLFLYASKARVFGQSTVMYGIPTYPFWYVVAAVMAVACLVQFFVFVAQLDRLIRGEVRRDRERGA